MGTKNSEDHPGRQLIGLGILVGEILHVARQCVVIYAKHSGITDQEKIDLLIRRFTRRLFQWIESDDLPGFTRVLTPPMYEVACDVMEDLIKAGQLGRLGVIYEDRETPFPPEVYQMLDETWEQVK
jgi:hypothetical protein